MSEQGEEGAASMQVSRPHAILRHIKAPLVVSLSKVDSISTSTFLCEP